MSDTPRTDALGAKAASRQEEFDADDFHDAMELARQLERENAELRDTLIEIDERLKKCGYGISAMDAYDSFYQLLVSEAIAKATQP